MGGIAYIDERKLEVDSLARFLAALVHKPAPDMSGDIWKALGEGMRKKYERIAADLVDYLVGKYP